MQTPLHAAVATPSQRLAAAARRERQNKIAALAHPDSPIACPSASVRSRQALGLRPSPPPAAAVPTEITAMCPERAFDQSREQTCEQTWPKHQEQLHAPVRTWFWIVDDFNPRRLTIEDIQRAVEQHCRIAHLELISARRTAAVMRPRQIAMYLARHLTPNSLPAIGRQFGGRDHTTVLHAVRKIEARLPCDKILAGDIDAIRQALSAKVA